jgi:O-antigen ligase
MASVGENRPQAARLMASLGAVALGATVPILVLGRTEMAVVGAIAVIMLLAGADRSKSLEDILAALRTPLGIAVAITFAFWLVSVIGSIDVARSASVWIRMVALLAFGVALAALLRRDRCLETLALKALIASATACALLALATIYVWPEPYLLLHSDIGDRDPGAMAALFLKSYGAAVACAMPVVLWAGWRLGQNWRLPATLFQVVAIALMFALEYRAGLVAAAAGAGVFACWFVIRHGQRWLAVAIVVAMAAVVAGAFLTNVRGNKIEVDTGIPAWLVDAHRQAIWGRGLKLAAEAPLFGNGLNIIERLPGASEIVPGSDQAYIPSHPHNWMIEVFVETGVIGFAAMVGTLVLLVWGTIRAVRRDHAPGVCLLALTAAFFVISSISFSFWSFWWQSNFVLLAAMIIATLKPGHVSGGFGPVEARS